MLYNIISISRKNVQPHLYTLLALIYGTFIVNTVDFQNFCSWVRLAGDLIFGFLGSLDIPRTGNQQEISLGFKACQFPIPTVVRPYIAVRGIRERSGGAAPRITNQNRRYLQVSILRSLVWRASPICCSHLDFVAFVIT